MPNPIGKHGCGNTRGYMVWETRSMFYPLDEVLTKIFDESPTTEIIACEKRSVGNFGGEETAGA